MASNDYNIFSKQLPHDQAAIAANSLTPVQRRRLISAFADKFRLRESEASAVLEDVAKENNGYLPTLQNLRQNDVGWAKPKRSDALFSQIDNLLPNALGRSVLANKAPVVSWINPGQLGFRALGAVVDPAIQGGKKAIDLVAGKHKDDMLVDMTKEVALPAAGYGLGLKYLPRLARRGTLAASRSGYKTLFRKLPKGQGFSGWFGKDPIGGLKTSFTAPKAGILSRAGNLLRGVGSAVDIADAAINTRQDIKDTLSGAKKQRYTDETIQALGKGATPWQAANYYQIAKSRDALVDHAKLASIILSRGATGGMVTAFGGSRLNVDNILPYQDIIHTGVKDLYHSLSKRRSSAIERRMREYRNRDGWWQGMGKALAGNYFSHERDKVLNDLKQERRAFNTAANSYLKQHNPNLYKRLTGAASNLQRVKLIQERQNWLKNTKAADKQSYFDKAIKASGADASTL